MLEKDLEPSNSSSEAPFFSPKTPNLEMAFDSFTRIKKTWPEILDRAEEKVERGELELIGWGLTKPRIQLLTKEEAQGKWYFIGDLHNDFLAWHTLLTRVSQDEDFRLCFLGDLIDRGPHHIECLAAILEAVERFPNQILWILGNHEEGVGFNPNRSEGQSRYASTVDPSEFVDWLNSPGPEIDQARTDRILCLLSAICKRLPRAVLFPDGLLATHGGIPLEDRWATLVNMEAFHHDRTLADFTWTRAAESPIKRGWQHSPEKRARSSDFEYGWRDLEGFAKAVKNVFPVQRMVRGHDHVAGGSNFPEGYLAVPVLTLNAFGFDYLTNQTSKYRNSLALGVGVIDQLPHVEDVPVAINQRNLFYGTNPLVGSTGEIT